MKRHKKLSRNIKNANIAILIIIQTHCNENCNAHIAFFILRLYFLSLYFLYNFRLIYLFTCTKEDFVTVEMFLTYYIVLKHLFMLINYSTFNNNNFMLVSLPYLFLIAYTYSVQNLFL